MHSYEHSSKLRWLAVAAALAIALLVFAACAPAAPSAGSEATAAATEEAAAETATVTATEEATEEATATAEEEATAEATEESAAEATAEATAAPAEEATAAPAEEATQEAAAGGVAMIGDPQRGGYIFAATTGCGCHFNRDLKAPAGGMKFEGPFGVVYAPNITSDPETGIGNWTDQQIVDALRLGKTPDGRQLHPIMPYMAWSAMSDQDAYDMAAALKMLPPVKNEVPKSELTNPVAPFTPAAAPPAVAPTTGVERGAYLVALGQCNNCHTPKTDQGAPDTTRLLAGAVMMGDDIAPNLTPDESSGLGAFSDDEIVHFLMTGEYDDGSKVEGPMERVVQNGTSKLTEDDVRSIVAYLRSIPAVADKPQ
ncbi:MAG: c-type cytochrome [Caldilineaceae bacterium]